MREIEIVTAHVEPMLGFGNAPELYVAVTGEITYQDLRRVRYGRCDDGCEGARHFLAEYEGFLVHKADGRHDGSGRDSNPISLLDGSTYSPRGMWCDSNAGEVNRHFPRADYVHVSVGFNEGRPGSLRGWTPGFGLPAATARQAIERFCPTWEIAPHAVGDLVWEPRLKGHGFKDEEREPYRGLTDPIDQRLRR